MPNRHLNPVPLGPQWRESARRALVTETEGMQQLIAALDGPLGDGLAQSVEVIRKAKGRVVMTGMGSDGADGLAAMRRAGARTLAQDEATSVVWGMPGEAWQRGAAESLVALPDVAQALLERLKRVDAPGVLLTVLFRQYFAKMIREMRNTLYREVHCGPWRIGM